VQSADRLELILADSERKGMSSYIQWILLREIFHPATPFNSQDVSALPSLSRLHYTQEQGHLILTTQAWKQTMPSSDQIPYCTSTSVLL